MKNWAITIVFFGIFVFFSMIYFAVNGFDMETLQTQIQVSARASFVLFIITFSSYPIFKISERNITKWFMFNRKYFGVTFALIHFYHLGLLVIKNNIFEPVFSQINLSFLISGIITYMFIAFMLLTSLPKVSDNLSEKQWPRLHIIGGYIILTVFTVLYVRLALADKIYLPFVIMALFVWFLRLIFKKFI